MPPKSLKHKLVALVEEDTLTRKDFTEAFTKVLDALKKRELQLNKALQDLQELHKKAERALKDANNQDLSSVREEIKQARDKSFKEQADTLNFIRDKVRNLKPGKDADEEKIIEEVLERIQLPEVKEPILDGPEEIRNKLESLGENLGLSFIEGIKKELEEKFTKELEAIRERLSNVARGSGSGRAKVPMIRPVNLTSQCNGQTKTFNLGRKDVTQVIGIFSSQFPFTGDDAVDFTLDGSTLTLGSEMPAVEEGQTLWALCETLFHP